MFDNTFINRSNADAPQKMNAPHQSIDPIDRSNANAPRKIGSAYDKTCLGTGPRSNLQIADCICDLNIIDKKNYCCLWESNLWPYRWQQIRQKLIRHINDIITFSLSFERTFYFCTVLWICELLLQCLAMVSVSHLLRHASLGTEMI